MSFAVVVLLVVAVALAAILSNRITELLRVPAPVLVLVAAAVVVEVVPDLHAPPEHTVERIVTIALLCILFDGGMHIGLPRLRSAWVPVTVVGVLGTFLTVAGAGLLLHLGVGLPWYLSLLVATAVAPTDPAVVFSVLGSREIRGRSGTVLEGESGANDPVGIALMTSLLAAHELSPGAFGTVAVQFVLQMAVGLAVGVVGGIALIWFMRHVPLPSAGLYPIRTLTVVIGLYAVATLAHGSGFLAVFVCGILTGEQRAPYKREVENFHAALASLAEMVAFVVLGLTIDLGVLTHADVWVPGLVLGAVLAAVIRPLAVGVSLIGSELRPNEKAFIQFAGLKGAVPILLGTLILAEHVAQADRLYGIVVVVVVFSVLVQGTFVPTVARLLKVPMRTVAPEPWALGVRLRDEPDGVLRLTVRPGSGADGRTLEELHTIPESSWISFVVRDGRLVRVQGATRLQAGDEALVISDPADAGPLRDIFERPL